MRTFRNRLLVLIIGLVVVAQPVTFVAVLARTEHDVRARAADELAAGASVARQVLRFRAAQLAAAVGVLAADFGLREAVASGDRLTIESAVANHSRRIGADLVIVLDDAGRLVSSSHGETQLDAAVTRGLTSGAGADDAGGGFLALGDDVFQILAAPVLAPDVVGWVALGFRVDRALASEVRDLVNVEVTFVAAQGADARIVAATLDDAEALILREPLRALTKSREAVEVRAGADAYLAYAERLGRRDDGLALLVLKPMSAVLAPYGQLRSTLGWISGFALLLAIAVGTALGRGATRPIDRLVAGARRIERGEYDADFVTGGGEEFSRLAATLGTMQRGIAEREARILHQTLHDPLTGLPNRKQLESLLVERLEAGAGAAPTTILLIEAANLGQFSASLGFEFADEVLVELASRLGREAPRGSLVARLEGARFAVVAPFTRAAPAEAWALALRDALGAGLHAASLQARLELFVGVVLAPEHGDQPAELLRRAETALERARTRQAGVVLFTLEQDRQQRRRVELSHDLPDALDSAGFAIVLQPKVDFAARRIRGAEVLARWTHPTLGAIPPDEFLPLAEQTGSGGRLTRRVLSMALDALARWHRAAPRLELAINLTASDIADPALPDFVLEQLRARGLPATCLVLEITESAVMRDADVAARHMEQLRHAGLRFAIDDFGTGFSSLALLNRLPFDELKIDKSFVLGAARDPDAAAIIRATVELARSLELRVVAEGVETEASWEMLAALGCDYAQGYLISRPLPASDFDDLLRRESRSDAVGNADPRPALAITRQRSGAV